MAHSATAIRRDGAAPSTVAPRRWSFDDHGFSLSAHSLALYRVLYCVGLLTIYSPASTLPLADLPDSLFHPPLGPMMLLDGWPPRGGLLALELLAQVALVLVLVGLCTRSASLTLAATQAVLAGFRFSTGKIDHDFVLLVAVPLLFAFTSWGHAFSLDASRRRVRATAGFRRSATWPVQALALSTGLMYATSAVAKAGSGWLDPSGSATRGWMLGYLHEYPWAPNLVNQVLLRLDAPLLWEVVDVAGVVMEAGVLIACLRRRWFMPYLLVLVSFHAAVDAFFSINFAQLLLVYLAFVRLDRAATRLRLERIDRLPRWVLPVVAGALTSAAVAETLRHGTSRRLLPYVDALTAHSSGLWIPVVVLLVAGVVLVRRQRPGGPATEPFVPAEGRAPSLVAGAAAVVLAAQLSMMATVGEPYPAVTGPLFMGNRMTDDGVLVMHQDLTVDSGGVAAPFVPEVVMSGGTYLVNLRQVRFPAPPVDATGRQLPADATLWTRLEMRGHTFGSDWLPGYDGALARDARQWLRSGVEAAGIPCGEECALTATWSRILLDPATGTEIPGSRRVVSERRWEL